MSWNQVAGYLRGAEEEGREKMGGDWWIGRRWFDLFWLPLLFFTATAQVIFIKHI